MALGALSPELLLEPHKPAPPRGIWSETWSLGQSDSLSFWSQRQIQTGRRKTPQRGGDRRGLVSVGLPQEWSVPSVSKTEKHPTHRFREASKRVVNGILLLFFEVGCSASRMQFHVSFLEVLACVSASGRSHKH